MPIASIPSLVHPRLAVSYHQCTVCRVSPLSTATETVGTRPRRCPLLMHRSLAVLLRLPSSFQLLSIPTVRGDGTSIVPYLVLHHFQATGSRCTFVAGYLHMHVARLLSTTISVMVRRTEDRHRRHLRWRKPWPSLRRDHCLHVARGELP